MEPCRVRGEWSIQSDGSTYLKRFYGSQSCGVWMPHKLKDHSCERWKHCHLCLTAGELRYSKLKYLGQGHCGNLWQSKVCQIELCQVSSGYVDDWASFPRSMRWMGCSCLLSPSAPSSLSWVVMVGAPYLQATEKDQAKPSLRDAVPSMGWLRSPEVQEDDGFLFPRSVGNWGQNTSSLFITRVWTVAPSPSHISVI